MTSILYSLQESQKSLTPFQNCVALLDLPLGPVPINEEDVVCLASVDIQIIIGMVSIYCISLACFYFYLNHIVHTKGLRPVCGCLSCVCAHRVLTLLVQASQGLRPLQLELEMEASLPVCWESEHWYSGITVSAL